MKNSKKLLLSGIILFLFSANLFAQGPDTVWTRTFGGILQDACESVKQTSDKGYILVGETRSFSSSLWDDVWLIKTDSLGDTIWTKTYGRSGAEIGMSVQQTFDGGYIITGYTNSYGAGMIDIYLVKTDSLGDTLWTKTYGGTDFDNGWEVQQTIDGGYIIIGETQSFGPGSRDVWLIKTDSSGDSMWTRIYGGVEYDIGYSVQQTCDGGYVIGGKTASIGAGLTDAWLLKIEPDVSIKEEQVNHFNLLSTNIKIFPNPFKNILNIEGCSKVKIYDISGKFVSEIKDQWDGKNSKGEEVKAGIYFIKAKGFSTKKIVKMK